MKCARWFQKWSARAEPRGIVGRRLLGAVVLLVAACGDGGTEPPPPPPSPATGAITGQVTVEGSGVQGVLVSLSGAAAQSAATGADGSFRFVTIPAGSHTVTLSGNIPEGVVFSRTTLSVTISTAGQEVRADFPGEYLRTSAISGTVTAFLAADRTEAVEGLVLRLTGVEEAADTTDANGRYGFGALRAGEYTVSLDDTREYAFETTSYTTTLTPGQSYQQDFVGSKTELFVATDSLGVGRLTIPFSTRLTAFGGSGDYVWSLAEGSRLPEGLELTNDGAIVGTPVAVGVTDFDVRVIDSEMTEATAGLSLRVCEGPLGLGVGDFEVFEREAPAHCGVYVQAPEAGAWYRVTMTGTSAGDRYVNNVALTVEGRPGARTAAVMAAAEPHHQAAAESVPPGDWAELIAIEEANARAHALLRSREAELFERLRAQGPLQILPDRSGERMRAARDRGGAADAPSEYEFRISNPFESGGACQVDTTVTATLVAQNDYLAAYEYGSTSSVENVQRTLDFYAEHGKEVIDRYFDGVSDVNGDGIVVVLIRPELEDAIAYVWSADMTLSRTGPTPCPSSNEMELVHMEASLFEQIDEDRYGAFGTLVHEMKHVSSLYKRIRGNELHNDYFHPNWIEEGTAEIAKEIASRVAWERAGGPARTDRIGFEQIRDALRGDARAQAYGVFINMARTVWAFSTHPNAITYAPVEDEGDVYGSGWHFHRFLRDWTVTGVAGSPADESFIRTLNDSLTAPGVRGIEAVTGRTMEELLVQHALAITFAGNESNVGSDVPTFRGYDFPTATEVFSNPDPPGYYPWPVTTTGEDEINDENIKQLAPIAAPLAASDTIYDGRLGANGIRVHDFRAVAAGDGAAFYYDIPASARVIVARIRVPFQTE